MRAIAIATALGAVFSFNGCRERTAPVVEVAESAIEAEPAVPVTIYPVVILNPPPEVIAGAEAAQQVSDAHDAQCALMDISPALAAQRPDGVGCPRPSENQD